MDGPMSVRRILVPTDFSDHATAAMRYAGLLGERFGAELMALHAAMSASRLAAMAGGAGWPLDAAAEDERALRAQLAKSRSEVLGQIAWDVQVAYGAPAPAILDTARMFASDLIVMGTHGRTGLSRALLGSVAEEVIRRADRPVLTLRTTRSEKPVIERIVCPINYSEAAARAFSQAVFFASAFEAELTALFLEETATSDDQFEREAERLRAWVGDVPLSVRLNCVVRSGEPATQVVEYARAHGADLLVIGAQHRLRGGPRTSIGSTTDRVTRTADCPVLTVPTGTILIGVPDEGDEMPGGRDA